MIPALTIHQPYASLIASGAKRVENRVWRTAYRGNLWIHAGAKLLDIEGPLLPGETALKRPLPRQAIIAVVELVDCFPFDRAGGLVDPWELAGDAYASGPYCWILRNVRALPEPVACRGYQKLWVPEGVDLPGES